MQTARLSLRTAQQVRQPQSALSYAIILPDTHPVAVAVTRTGQAYYDEHQRPATTKNPYKMQGAPHQHMWGAM
eukprot:6304596-Heterocapsa_arctica.AAC.1